MIHFEQDFLADIAAGMWTSLKLLALLVALVLLALWLFGCSVKTYTSPEGMKLTSGSFIYCPEATVTRVQDGNRTVDMVGDGSGVGDTLQGIVEGLR